MVRLLSLNILLWGLCLFAFAPLSAQNCTGVTITFPDGGDTLSVCPSSLNLVNLYDIVPPLNPGDVGQIYLPGIDTFILDPGFSEYSIPPLSLGIQEITYILSDSNNPDGNTNKDTCTKFIEVVPMSFQLEDDPDLHIYGGFWLPCVGDDALDLRPYVSPTGGTFSGPGVDGDFIDPSATPSVDSLVFYTVNYEVEGLGVCALNTFGVSPVVLEAEIVSPTSGIICRDGGPVPIIGNFQNDGGVTGAGIFSLDGEPLTSSTTPGEDLIEVDTLYPAQLELGPVELIYTLLIDGCYSYDTLQLEIVESPESANIDIAKTTLCKSDVPIALSLSPEGGTLINNGLSINVDNEIEPELTPVDTYELIYQFGDAGECASSDTVEIKVVESVYLNYVIEHSSCNRIPDQIYYLGDESLEDFDLSWDLSEGKIVENQRDSLLLVDWEFPGSYTLTLNYPEGSCISSGDNLVLDVAARSQEQDTCLISTWLPNAFTPNEDGRNDVFKLEGQGIEAATLHIYDRFGGKMFESPDWQIGWDGTFDGAPVRTGVYFYFAEIKLEDGTEVLKEGDFTLIR